MSNNPLIASIRDISLQVVMKEKSTNRVGGRRTYRLPPTRLGFFNRRIMNGIHHMNENGSAKKRI